MELIELELKELDKVLAEKRRIEFMFNTMGIKITQRKLLTELLKKFWLSAFMMQQALQSSSADRIMRFIREEPPEGYSVRQIDKKIEGYEDCLQYKLVKNGSLF